MKKSYSSKTDKTGTSLPRQKTKGYFRETTLERADFTLQLLMYVTAEKERVCVS